MALVLEAVLPNLCLPGDRLSPSKIWKDLRVMVKWTHHFFVAGKQRAEVVNTVSRLAEWKLVCASLHSAYFTYIPTMAHTMAHGQLEML
jgi:hypothetical protein